MPARKLAAPPDVSREPSATKRRGIQSANRRDSSARALSDSTTRAMMRLYSLRHRTAQAPPTAASVEIAANVAAMPMSMGSVLRAKGCSVRRKDERQHRQDARTQDSQCATERIASTAMIIQAPLSGETRCTSQAPWREVSAPK